VKDAELKRCCACGSNLAVGYHICTQCGTHQKRLYRGVQFALKAFAAVSIVAGAISVTISFYPQVKKVFSFKEDVELVSVNTTVSGTPGTLSFLNKGDGDVFVSELIVRLRDHSLPFEIRLPIHQLIKKDELRGLRVGSRAASSNIYSDTVGPNQFQAWLDSRTQSEIDDQINRCFLMKPFDQQKGGYVVSRVISSHPAVAIIRFYSPENRSVVEVQSNIPLRAALFRRASELCKTEKS